MTAISLRKAADMLSLWPAAVNVLAAVSAVVAVAAGVFQREINELEGIVNPVI